MNITRKKDGFEVESSSKKGLFYKVDPQKPWCDCPEYKFREIRRKGICKHIKAVREYIEQTQQKTLGKENASPSVEKFIDSHGGKIDSIELIEKFGEETVDSMIKRGELIEENGKISILK